MRIELLAAAHHYGGLTEALAAVVETVNVVEMAELPDIVACKGFRPASGRSLGVPATQIGHTASQVESSSKASGGRQLDGCRG